MDEIMRAIRVAEEQEARQYRNADILYDEGRITESTEAVHSAEAWGMIAMTRRQEAGLDSMDRLHP